jgi:hypothetical protein
VGPNVTVIEVDGPSIDSNTNVFDFSFMGSSLEEATSHYERLYLSEASTSTQEIHSEPTSPDVTRPTEEPEPPRNEDITVTSTQTQTDIPRNVRSQDVRVPRRRGPRLVPIPLEPRRALQPVPHPFRPPLPLPPPQTMLTLREQQVLQLSREMRHPGGVRLQLRRKDCSGSIALVDAFGAVW